MCDSWEDRPGREIEAVAGDLDGVSVNSRTSESAELLRRATTIPGTGRVGTGTNRTRVG